MEVLVINVIKYVKSKGTALFEWCLMVNQHK